MSAHCGLHSYKMQIMDIQVHQPGITAAPTERSFRLDRVLESMKDNGFHSLGEFLVQLFTVASDHNGNKSLSLSQMVSSFLNGCSDTFDVITLVEILYHSRFSAPKAKRQSQTPNTQKHRPDETTMARYKLQQWAIGLVKGLVDDEARELVSPGSTLRLAKEMTWDFATSFLFHCVAKEVRKKSPTCMRLLKAVAIPAEKRNRARPSHLAPGFFTQWFTCAYDIDTSAKLKLLGKSPAPCSRAQANRQGKKLKRSADNYIDHLHDAFERQEFVIHRVPKAHGRVFVCQLGCTRCLRRTGKDGAFVSYATVLEVLKGLIASAQAIIRTSAVRRVVMFAYDNINRQRHVYDGELGERDMMNSGTASAYVVVEDCDPARAFDVHVLEEARAKQQRKELSVALLHNVMTVHVASHVIQEVPCLSPLQEHLNRQLCVDLAKHCMRDGRRTEVYPLASSKHDEGSTRGNRDVIDDLMLKQLGLEKDEAAKVLTIVTGDQSTIEKICHLKKLLDSCPHGYDRYGWVLPIIQLWHMGWADLERILATHWGPKSGFEDYISTLACVNELLGCKVKNVKRPDYYPAQALVFDTLRVEIINCWREYYCTEDLPAYFSQDPGAATIEQLLVAAEKIVAMYLSTWSAEQARRDPDSSHYFPVGKPWTAPAAPAGDQVLANTILRMRDIMLHYEFHSAVADGDIGRAMNVMAVWTFTFCGCGKSKYTNELLELACNFEYEYSDELKQAVLNNWLCNLTGHKGRWFPMDLMMEHNINLLKRMSGQPNTPFGAQFLKEVISLNIRYFLDVKESLHTAADDFATGHARFASTSQIANFVNCTMFNASNLHNRDESAMGVEEDTEEEDSGTGRTDIEDATGKHDIPLPHIWQDGELILDEHDDTSDDDNDVDDANNV
ncbi:hypothetical protein BC835DRAFT_1303523 [Cytidiella melzeri]|nr:hypothetical protein BC835DRAFT_1303523 [Cytidiella melzeri]